MAHRRLSWVLAVAGGLLLFLAVPAGHVNRTVLDAPTFADNVDELRRHEEVSRVLGHAVARQLIAQNPDLVAVAPLVETVATSVMRSDVLSGPVRVAASQFNRALTEADSDAAVLRVADAGAVVAGVLGAVAPEQAPQATQVAATLSNLGSQSWASGIIVVARWIQILAWLLPALGVACLVGSVLLASAPGDGIRRAGWAVVTAAGALATIVVAGGALATRVAGDERTDALVAGVWEVFVRPIWWPIAVLGAIGALAVVIGSGQAASWSPAAVTRRIAAEPATSWGIAGRGSALLVAGVATIVEPQGMLTLFAFVGGVLLVVTGTSALARVASPAGRRAPADPGRTWGPLAVVAVAGALLLGGLAVWAARSPGSEAAGVVDGVVAGEGRVCNGHAELCGRRFDEVSFAATHNSMSVAGKPGWYLGEQGLDIVPQLDFGVRALLVDVWYGTDAGDGRVRTSARSYEEALAIANEELGPEIVASALRVFDTLAPGQAGGEEGLYLCHGLCETGATSFDDTLADIRAWLATHPDEVLSIFIEDHVDASDVGSAVQAAGLDGYAYTPVAGQPFATLGDMIRSGKRLVVLLEEGDGRPEYPWLVNGFEFVQETPYTFPTVESFSCDENRGDPDAPLLQINHWLAGFTDLVSAARQVNPADVLGTRARQCRRERQLQPTFVAVNYADIGDLMAVVDDLNDVG